MNFAECLLSIVSVSDLSILFDISFCNLLDIQKPTLITFVLAKYNDIPFIEKAKTTPRGIIRANLLSCSINNFSIAGSRISYRSCTASSG